MFSAKKIALFALVAAVGLSFAAPAAHAEWRGRDRYHGHYYGHYYRGVWYPGPYPYYPYYGPGYAVAPPPVVYAPQPVYAAPAYPAPAPVGLSLVLGVR